MRRAVFNIFARLNKALLPKLWHKDLQHLNSLQKGVVAWRIWVTKNSLG